MNRRKPHRHRWVRQPYGPRSLAATFRCVCGRTKFRTPLCSSWHSGTWNTLYRGGGLPNAQRIT